MANLIILLFSDAPTTLLAIRTKIGHNSYVLIEDEYAHMRDRIAKNSDLFREATREELEEINTYEWKSDISKRDLCAYVHK